MKQLADQFGKMFTTEELLYELEKNNKDYHTTLNILKAKQGASTSYSASNDVRGENYFKEQASIPKD